MEEVILEGPIPVQCTVPHGIACVLCTSLVICMFGVQTVHVFAVRVYSDFAQRHSPCYFGYYRPAILGITLVVGKLLDVEFS